MEESLRFQKTMQDLYVTYSTEMALSKSYDEILGGFDEIISTNQGRVNFICNLIDLSIKGQVSPTLFELFKSNYEYLYEYMMGERTRAHFVIPKRIKENIHDIRYLPDNEELTMLLDMVAINYNTFNRVYNNNQLFIKIPDDSLYKNMYERLEINKNNIAHLLGITSRHSALVKLFVDVDKQKHPEYYDQDGNIIDKENNGIAIRIVDFYTSEEGRNYLLRINESINKYISLFEERNPGSVDDANGGVRTEYQQQFNQEFESVFGFRYPLLEYNKMYVKNVGFYNQTEMSFVSEIILDYDSRKSEDKQTFKSKKFLVHYDAKEHLEQIEMYNSLTSQTIEIIKLAAQLPEQKGLEVLEKLKLERHKPLLYQFRNNLSSRVLENLNIRNTDLINQINNLLNEMREKHKGTTSFPYDTQLLGFIQLDHTGQEYGINQVVLNTGVCETNLEVSVPELIQEFYKHSRRYYIDAIKDSNGNYVRVGNLKQEEEYHYITRHIEKNAASFERLEELQGLKDELKDSIEKFRDYISGYTPPKHSKK